MEILGTVLYNSGSDFIGLEIFDGKLRFLVGKGSNAVELISDRNVSDGKWHTISVAYSPFLVEVRRWTNLKRNPIFNLPTFISAGR